MNDACVVVSLSLSHSLSPGEEEKVVGLNKIKI